MTTILALILFLVFLSLSMIHFYWGLGGAWGTEAVLPTRNDQKKAMSPGMVECFVVALGLLGFGLFVLIRAGVLFFALPAWMLAYGLWIIAFIFTLRAIGDFKYVGFFKKVTQSKFARNDTKFYSPLCLAIGILALWLAMSL